MDDDCRAERRRSRMLERRYRRTMSANDRLAWVKQENNRHRIYLAKEQQYWQDRLTEHSKKPRKLWQTIDSVLQRGQNKTGPQASDLTAETLSSYFIDKVNTIRSSTSSAPQPVIQQLTSDCSFNTFRPCTSNEVRQLISASPNKTCQLDPLPTNIVKEFLPQLLPFIVRMCNQSLLSGQFPASHRHAIVTPILKKVGLDASVAGNYRPISGLTFVSKLIERLAAKQLIAYLDMNRLWPVNQSAYRANHSTETVIMDVLTNIYAAIDRREVTVMAMLDQSAAFDLVDHDILLKRLGHTFGLTGGPLSWLTSFLSHRSQTVNYGGELSTCQQLHCGVPQGSSFGPLLFSLYTADLYNIASSHNVASHSYADDIQLCVSASVENLQPAVDNLSTCIDNIENWMSSNRLKLNADKTQLTVFGTRQQLGKLTLTHIRLGSSNIEIGSQATDLGVQLDSELKMSSHVQYITRTCYYQLRQLRSIRRSLSADVAKSLVRALILTRMDYCNSALYGAPSVVLSRLQSVLNASAKLIARRSKYDHISAFIRDDLHWLPITERIEYKLCLQTYKCLHGVSPNYLEVHCRPLCNNSGRRNLRSAASGQLLVPATKTSYGARSFAVAGPLLYNSLPVDARDTHLTFTQFKVKLKTYLFKKAYNY